jgi:hypothetical protein
VDLWEAVEGGSEGPARWRANRCHRDAFVPHNGCEDELARRCAGAWDFRPGSSSGQAACSRCAAEAIAAARLQRACSAAAVHRWCQGFTAFTCGVGCTRGGNGSALYEVSEKGCAQLTKTLARSAHTKRPLAQGALFEQYAAEKLANHSTRRGVVPLLLFFSAHTAHSPLQVPQGAAIVVSFLAAVLTAIYLCGVCSCQKY